MTRCVSIQTKGSPIKWQIAFALRCVSWVAGRATGLRHRAARSSKNPVADFVSELAVRVETQNSDLNAGHESKDGFGRLPLRATLAVQAAEGSYVSYFGDPHPGRSW